MKSNDFGVYISPVGTTWLTARSTRERCTTYRVYLNPCATPGPCRSSPVGTNWCIQKWTEDARDFNIHKDYMYSVFLKGRPYLRQTITKEEISRVEKVDKAEAAQPWTTLQTVADTIFYSSLFLQQCLGVSVALGSFLVGIAKRLNGLNEKSI